MEDKDRKGKTKADKEKLKETQKNKPKQRLYSNVRTGFTINDVPLWLYKEFVKDIEIKYNDTYWVKLLDWYRKAETYDNLVNTGEVYDLEDIQSEYEIEKPKDKYGVHTATGFKEYSQKVQKEIRKKKVKEND